MTTVAGRDGGSVVHAYKERYDEQMVSRNNNGIAEGIDIEVFESTSSNLLLVCNRWIRGDSR